NPSSGAVITISKYINENNQTLDEVIDADPGSKDYTKEPAQDSQSDSEMYSLKDDITDIKVDSRNAMQYLWAYEGAYLRTVLLEQNNILYIDLDKASSKDVIDEEQDDFLKYRNEYDSLLKSIKFE